MAEALTESFCERCGTRYQFKAPTRLSALRKTRGMVSGLRNYLLTQDALSDSVDDAMRGEEDRLAARQLEAFHESFNFCIDCRQYTCVSCWNEGAGRCRSCAPVPGKDDLLERIEANMAGAAVADGQRAQVDAAYAPNVTAEAWPSSDLETARAGAAWPEHDWPAAELEHVAAAETAEAEAEVPAYEVPAAEFAEPAPDAFEAADAERYVAAEPEPVAPDIEVAAEPEPVAAEAEPYATAEPEMEQPSEWAAAPATEWTAEPSVDWSYPAPAEWTTADVFAEYDRTSEAAPEPAAAEAELEPVTAEAEAEPVMAEAEPVVAEAEFEPILVEAEREPEPVIAEAHPESEPVLAEAAREPEPAVAPTPITAWDEDTSFELEPLPEPELELEPIEVVAETAPEPASLAPTLEPVAEPAIAEYEPEPVVAGAEAEPEPVVAEAEPEPEPVVAEVEPEPVVAAVEEPQPVAAEQPREPAPPPVPREVPSIGQTILHLPQRATPQPPDHERVAAEADSESLAARRAQLDLLGLEDAGQGEVKPERPTVLPYRSRGATVHPSELARTVASVTEIGSFWEASAREVAGAASHIGVQNCAECGLSLSASARFCRRCGTRQARPA